MLKKAVSGTMLMLLLTGILALILNIQSAMSEQTSIIVPDDYPTIQEAINSAVDGDTIFVKAGTYYEHVVVNKMVTLIGDNEHTTIIDGNATGYVVRVTSDKVIITGFSIQEGGHIYPDYGGCVYLDSDDVIINQNILRNAGSGVLVSGHHRNIISQNIVTNTTLCGIAIDSSTNHKVFENNITYTQFPAIYAKISRENEFRGNFLANNTGGIYLGLCNNSYVVENTIYNSWVGITLDFSSYNSLKGNRVYGNMLGLGLGILAQSYQERSHHNVVVENDFSNNEKGLNAILSGDNLICRNNFVNNTCQFSSHLSKNIWDDGLEGNYWSNYTGVDLDHDGIGDTSHDLDEENEDNRPLMGVFSDFVATPECHVQTVCNSTISEFKYNGTAVSFNVSGEDGTAGFCRICIPTVLMNETYLVFVNGAEVACNLLPCSNSTRSYLYFNYTHSTQEVIIVPEFPSLPILPLLAMATLLAITAYRRRPLGLSRRYFSINRQASEKTHRTRIHTSM